jgi:hypothetical protein
LREALSVKELLWIPFECIGPYRLGGALPSDQVCELTSVKDMESAKNPGRSILVYEYEDLDGCEISVIDGAVQDVSGIRAARFGQHSIIGMRLEDLERLLGVKADIVGPYRLAGVVQSNCHFQAVGLVAIVLGDGRVHHISVEARDYEFGVSAR